LETALETGGDGEGGRGSIAGHARGAAKLKAQRKPFWRNVEHGTHVGYYRPGTAGRPGTWIARRYCGGGRYETHALGLADDRPGAPADGERVLTFDMAAKAARAWGRERREADAAAVAKRATTVRDALERYLAARIERDPRQGRAARWRFTHHVLGTPLADKPVAMLRERDLTDWRAGLVRGGRGANGRPLSPSTVKRLGNDLRAALAAAARRERCGPDALAAVKDGLKAPPNADLPRAKQVLSDADVRRVVEAARAVDADFGDLILTLAATGARVEQVARLTVADLQADRLMVPVSRKGVGAKPRTHVAVPIPPDVAAQLRQCAAGRRGHEPLLTKARKQKVYVAETRRFAWKVVGRQGWGAAPQIGRPWAAALRLAGLPGDLVPYALRHSSIVRQLRVGLPLRLVASAHDTGTAMIERHYGAFIVDASDDLLRRTMLPLAPASVTPLREAG
jgi:integrase